MGDVLLNVSLIQYVRLAAVMADETLAVVRIHVVFAQSHGVLGDGLRKAVVLRHHVIRNHPPALAHVDLVRPAACFDEVALGQPV